MRKKLIVVDKCEDQKGVAIMMALFFTALISFMLFELSKETLYEAISASQNIHELRSYYAAKAGQDLSLLRIKAYQSVKSQIESMGEQAQPFASKASIIWEFPFAWPPILPDGAPLDTQNQLKTTLTETFFKKVAYAPLIEDMGGLVDINNLDSPSKALADSTKEIILEMYRKKIQNDQVFARKYSIDSVTRLVNNMIDWMDTDSESLNGGSEISIYGDRDQLYIPPNQHFKIKSEILLVEGMDQELFNVIEKSITVLGNPGVNINTADVDVIISLDPRMTVDIAQELIRRRQDLVEHGPFVEATFKDFVEEKLGSYSEFNPGKIPILYLALANFRIESIGTSGKIIKKIVTYVYDQTDLLDIMVEGLQKDYEKANPNSGQPQNPDDQNSPQENTGANQNPAQATKKPARTIKKGPPDVVFRKVY